MTFATWRKAALGLACAALLQACGGGGDDSSPASPSGQADPTTDFINLLSTLAYANRLTMLPLLVADVDSGVMRAPADLCTRGSVSGVTLNGEEVSGGEPLADIDTDVVQTRFDACALFLSADVGTPELAPVLTGASTIDLLAAVDEASYNVLSSANMDAMVDSSTAIREDGLFRLSNIRTAPDELGQARVSTAWSPASGSKLTHLSTGRTAIFVGGSFTQTTTEDSSGNTVGESQVLSSLTYTVNGATYVLNGSVVNDVGQITLSKNGTVTATLTVNGDGSRATGSVDPF